MAIREYIVKITDEVIPDGFERFENEYAPEGQLVRCKDCKNSNTDTTSYPQYWCHICNL